MLELDQYIDETIPVKISGQVYNLKSPGVGELSSVFSSIENKNHVKAIETSVEMLVRIGMPENVAKSLNMKSLTAIMQYIGESNSKKD